MVGIEVQLSNNHTILLQAGESTDDPTQQRADGSPKANAVRTLVDICDELQGRYPKDFKFTGWHPHCRCRAITILKTEEELARDTERMLRGEPPLPYHTSENAVNDMPEGFRDWMAANADRIKRGQQRGSLPYFVRDNEERVKSTTMLDNSYKPNTKGQHANENPKITHRKKLYEKLKNNPNYTDVAFNESNGGIKATHVKHNLDKSKGHYEKSAQEIGYQNGEIVILEEEIHSVLNQRNTEGTWNLIPFELAAAETGTSQNIRNALKHCASKPNAEVAVVYSLIELSTEAINAGLNRFNGLRNDPKQWKHFKEIIFIFPSGKIKKHFQK